MSSSSRSACLPVAPATLALLLRSMGYADAAVQAILAAIASARSITDDQLSMLYFIFEKNLERSLRILDQGGVHRVVSQPSERSVFQVIGESKTGPNSYLCFPDHFCSCQSFFFDVVSRSDQLCLQFICSRSTTVEVCLKMIRIGLGNSWHMCWLEGRGACSLMVQIDRALLRNFPSMAPTTRSARLSLEAQTLNCRTASASRAITVDAPMCKAESFQEGGCLKTRKTKANVKPDGALQRKYRIEATKEEKSSQVDQDKTPALDMEDLCSSRASQSDPVFSEIEVMAIRTDLLSWYDRNHRDLPWRINIHSCLKSPSDSAAECNECCKRVTSTEATKDASHLGVLSGDSVHAANETEGERAYAVWVSEMMLQQTRVATVISYYQRWMSTWPTVHGLAQASQEEVNTVWAGLGYYRRARFLLEGAIYIVEGLAGRFPRTVEELQKVPGIGSYTAGAIASIAFRQVVPVVDGNVIRVLCRLRAIASNPKASTTVKLFWALASQLVDEGRPGDFNQALMELGATICTPSSPSCNFCPVSAECTALKLVHLAEKNVMSVTCFPTKVPKSAPREEYVAVCIVEREHPSKMAKKTSSLLLVRRPLKGLLAGLWEFPSAPLDSPDTSEKLRSAAMDEYLFDTLGVELGIGGYTIMKREEFGTYVHVFSHIRLHMFIQWVLLNAEEVEGKGTSRLRSSVVTKWIDLDSMDSLGLTSGVKKVYAMFSALREKQLSASRSAKRKRINLA